MPHLTVLHVRDPDGACSIRLFADGDEEFEDFDVIDVDAGRGYTAEDWAENLQWAQDLMPGELREATLAAYGDPPGAENISGWDEREATR